MRVAKQLTAHISTVPLAKNVQRGGGGAGLLLTQITADYIALCHDPMAQLSRWIDEPRPDAFRGSIFRISDRGKPHEGHQSTSEPLGYAQRICAVPLHPMQSGLDALRRGGSGNGLPARSRAGPAQYDQLRSVRGEGSRGASLEQSRLDETTCDFSAEFAAVQSEFASRIAAARMILSSKDAASMIRRLLDEQTIAMRSITERKQLATRNRSGRPSMQWVSERHEKLRSL